MFPALFLGSLYFPYHRLPERRVDLVDDVDDHVGGGVHVVARRERVLGRMGNKGQLAHFSSEK